MQQTLSKWFLARVQSGCATPWERASGSLLLCAASFSLHVVTRCMTDPGTRPHRALPMAVYGAWSEGEQQEGEKHIVTA